jgi:hypothetical protein
VAFPGPLLRILRRLFSARTVRAHYMYTAAGQSGVGDAAEGRGEAPKMGAELLTEDFQ